MDYNPRDSLSRSSENCRTEGRKGGGQYIDVIWPRAGEGLCKQASILLEGCCRSQGADDCSAFLGMRRFKKLDS